jgi:hypothetical protein
VEGKISNLEAEWLSFLESNLKLERYIDEHFFYLDFFDLACFQSCSESNTFSHSGQLLILALLFCAFYIENTKKNAALFNRNLILLRTITIQVPIIEEEAEEDTSPCLIMMFIPVQ